MKRLFFEHLLIFPNLLLNLHLKIVETGGPNLDLVLGANHRHLPCSAALSARARQLTP